MPDILEVKNLTKSYGAVTALKNVSMAVPEGKIVGLLGPNGSGKTTMIKLINGLLHGYDGELKIDGEAPGIRSKELVAYLPDRDVLPPWMRVGTTIRMYADYYKNFDAERAREMLKSLNVSDRMYVRQLSKGMREKLQLTLTMSRRARLYVLDEPIAGVDPAAREVILSTILQNFGEGSSILMSTHIISDVEQIFDRVVFLREGDIVIDEEAETLRTREGKSLDGIFREVFRC